MERGGRGGILLLWELKVKGCDSSFQGAEYFWPEKNCFLVTNRD